MKKIECLSLFDFTCNICGTTNRWDIQKAHREVPSCDGCGSTPRFRGLMAVLSMFLYDGKIKVMNDVKPNPKIKGLGMSEWEGYGKILDKKYTFLNTFYHTEPFLDISGPTVPPYCGLDFVICTEVFEHIDLPLERAFSNLWHLLKPGGCLIFSVPYTDLDHSIEYYPDLYEHQCVNFKDEWILVNRTAEKKYEVYSNLSFHGGPGSTLERRFFCEKDMVNYLKGAGFTDLEIHDSPHLACGFYWTPITLKPPIINGEGFGPDLNCPAHIVSARKY